ncbi:MAG: vWA domain-containing protein [Gemmataceae bacterium]
MAKSRGSSGRRPSRGLLFPLSLAGLLLLALPGAGLLLVSLLGQETQANDWLRSHLGLGYHNPLPFLPSLFLLLLPLVLLLLYFLRLRRPPLLVPSTLLWRKSIDDLRVNSLFQWLRDHFLLLIQLGVVLLLLHSILAIQIHGQTAREGSHFIVLIDSSASMAATDVGPNRLEKARQLALELIDSRPEGDTGMIIEFNSQATIRQPYTSEKSLLRSAVRSIGQTQRPTRLDEALTLADGLANPHRSMEDESVRPPGEDPAEARTYVAPEGRHAEVHLFSDGRFPDVPGFAAGNLGLVYHPVGASPEQVRNVGIVNLSLSRESDRSGQETRRRLVFVRLLSDLPAGEDVTVELEWRQPGQGEFRLLEQVVRLPGRSADPTSASKEEKLTELPGEATATFALGDIEESTTLLFHARLRNHRDQFALDDEAWMVAGPARRTRVLIVSPGNEILRNFFDLEETRRFADVSYLTPESLGDVSRYLQPARSGAFDLVIFDRCAPAKEDDMPAGNTFFIAEVPPPWKRGDMPAVPARSLLRPRSDHSLMRGLTGLDEIAFSEAFRFDLSEARVPPRIPRLLEAEGETALLFLLPRRSYQDLVLTFPLVNARGQ